MNETKFLKSILKRIDTPQKYKQFPTWLLAFSWISIVVILTALIHWEKQGVISNLGLVSCSFLLGSFMGIGVILKKGRASWQFLCAHINKTSVQERIKALGK